MTTGMFQAIVQRGRELEREAGTLESHLLELIDAPEKPSTKVARINARLEAVLEGAQRDLEEEADRAWERERDAVLNELLEGAYSGIPRRVEDRKCRVRREAAQAVLEILLDGLDGQESEGQFRKRSAMGRDALLLPPAEDDAETVAVDEARALREQEELRLREVEEGRLRLQRLLRPRWFRWVLFLLRPELQAVQAGALDEYVEKTTELYRLRVRQGVRRAITAYEGRMLRLLDEVARRATGREPEGRIAYTSARQRVSEAARRLSARPYDFTLYILAETHRAEEEPEQLEATTRRVRELLLRTDKTAQEIVNAVVEEARAFYEGIRRVSLIERIHQLKAPTETPAQFFRRIARRHMIPFTGINELVLDNPPEETLSFATPRGIDQELGIQAAEHHDEQKVIALMAWHHIPICALSCAAQAAAAVERREQEGKRPAFPQRDWQTRFTLNYTQPWDEVEGNWLLLGLASGWIHPVGRSTSWYDVNGIRLNGIARVQEFLRAHFPTRQGILDHWRRLFHERGVEGAMEELEAARERLHRHVELHQHLDAVLRALKAQVPTSPQEFESILLFTRADGSPFPNGGGWGKVLRPRPKPKLKEKRKRESESGSESGTGKKGGLRWSSGTGIAQGEA